MGLFSWLFGSDEGSSTETLNITNGPGTDPRRVCQVARKEKRQVCRSASRSTYFWVIRNIARSPAISGCISPRRNP